MRKPLFDDQYIVVTGAAGFIGSCFTQFLNEKGFTNLILVDDVRKTIKWKNLVGKCFNQFISKDELFPWLKRHESQVEAIVHLGACSATTEEDFDYLMRVNTGYSIQLAEIAFDQDIRFIYASSAATYGMGEKGYSDDESKLDQLHPLNQYGYSKHMFDQWLHRNHCLDRAVGLKFFNVYGPNEYHKGRMASMVHHMTRAILQDGKVKLFKSYFPEKYQDGDQTRDFIYVKDVVQMIYFFLLNDEMGIYNIGCGMPSTWNELAHAVFSALKVPPHIEYIPMPQDLIGRYQDYTCADMHKFQKSYQSVHGKPYQFISLKDGVLDCVQNYVAKELRW